MRKLYMLGHSQCRLQSRAQVGASSPFTHCTRFVFVLLLLLGGVMQGAVGQIVPTAYMPTNGNADVDVNTQISIAFGQSIKFSTSSSTLNRNLSIRKAVWGVDDEDNPIITGWSSAIFSITISSGSTTLNYNGLSANVDQTNSSNQLILTLGNKLESNTVYTVSFSSGILVDAVNNNAVQGLSSGTYQFTTAPAAQAPTCTFSPATGATGVSLSPTLSMTFNEEVSRPDVNKYLRLYKVGETTNPIEVNATNTSLVAINGSQVSISVTGLVAGTSYYVTVDAGFVKSSASEVDFTGIAGNSTWTFTTGSAPQLSAISPVNEALDVALSPTLVMTFDEVVSRPDVNKYLRLYKVGETTNPIEVNSTNTSLVAINGSEVSISVSGLEQGANYYVLVEPGFVKSSSSQIDFAGIAEETTWTFTTGSAPQLVAENPLSPVNGATGVTLSPTLSMTFNESVVKSTVDRYLNIYKKDGTFITTYNVRSGSVVVEGSVVSIPVLGLAAGTEYYVTVDGGFVTSSTSGIDYVGITGSTTWIFTTGSAPQLVAENPLSPANGATGVLLDANMTATFDVPVRFNLGSESKLISITEPSGSFINYVVANGVSTPAGVSIVGNVLTIDPSSNFEFGTNYSVSIQSGALESMEGIPFAGIAASNWSFTTENAPAPVGTLATPTGSDISILTDVVITYDVAIRNMDGTVITDANVKNLIEIFQGEGAGVLMASTNYIATIAADKRSITIRLAPGSYYNPNSDVNVVIGKVENNQSVEQNLKQTFTFQTGIYNTWLGTTDSDWTKVSNWGGTYTEGASVIIKAGANGAILNNNLSIPNVIIAEGGQLTINPGATLTVNSFFRMFSVNGTGASASLVVNGTLSTVPSKTFIYQGITNVNYDYYISSPVTGAQKSVVTPAGSVFEYNTATDQFSALGGSTSLTPGKGYGAYAPAGTSFSFSGNINQATSYSLSCDRTVKNYGWNLGGNPYPCAIDLKKAYDAGRFSNLKSHIYIRDNATLIQNAWNFLSNAGTLTGAEVPSMHAFWVQVQDVQSSGSLTIQSSDRVHNSYNYHKSAATSVVQQPTVKLFAQNGAVKDLSVITFIPGNDDAYDDYDSEKRLAMTSSVTDLYSVKEGRRLVINSFGEYSGSKEVPIGVYAKKAGAYTLGLASLAGFDQEVELKLVDYATSPATTHDLSSGDYSFTVAGNTFIDYRFVLQVSNKVSTGVEQPETNREVTIYAFRSDVVIENKGDAVGQYTIYDLSGRVITNGEVGAFSKVSVLMSVKGLVLGVVKTSKGMVNQKLLIE